ncbi:sensor histidine kinase [Phenylobacterium sp.]|uniref:sensor histidine kinase n=1 Tax=Phenylobacterium sp. TaxID=1871053 RepID=UPI00378427D2
MPFTSTSPQPAPERQPPSRTPAFMAGGAGLVVLALLVVFDRLPAVDALWASAVVVGATAFGLATARRSAEARFQALIRASAEQMDDAPPYPTLINALPDPILVISAGEADDLTSRRYIFANAAARHLLRITRSEGLLVSATRDPGVLAAAEEALYRGRDAEAMHDTGGAQAQILRAHARPLGLALNGRRLAVLVFRDETEFHRLERTRVDFLANASHELRTPLASMSGFIETLRGHARDDAGAREKFLGIMQAQADRMRRLIDDLLSLSRIELNEHIAPADRIDLSGVVLDVIDAAQPMAREKGVALDPELPEGPLPVVGDRDQIVQVVQNLVDNALKYSRAGGRVRIAAAGGLSSEAAGATGRPGLNRISLLTPDDPHGPYAGLQVSDGGEGIARENLPRLTERFYRVEGQKSGERSGTGLGLAIVKHIARRHRGGLSVESAVGQGATFFAWFPQPEEVARRGPAAVAKPS